MKSIRDWKADIIAFTSSIDLHSEVLHTKCSVSGWSWGRNRSSGGSDSRLLGRSRRSRRRRITDLRYSNYWNLRFLVAWTILDCHDLIAKRGKDCLRLFLTDRSNVIKKIISWKKEIKK